MKSQSFALVSLLLSVCIDTARSADLAWNGSVSTNWNTPGNWTPAQVPTAADHVMINSGNVTIPPGGGFAIMDWTGGSISGSLTVVNGAVLNLSGSAALALYGPLTNAGTVTATGTGYLRLVYVPSSGDYGSVYNLSGGLFDIQDDQFYIWNFSGNEFFDNAGTLRKSAGSGITIIYPLVTNSGLVDVETGTMNLAGGGTIDGQYNAAAGATILFNGNFISGANPQLTGGGADQFVSGTLTLLSNTIPNLQMNGGTLALGPKFQGGSITNLTLAGMVLSGANLVTGTATLGGGSSGPLTVAANAVLTCTAGNFCYPSGSITVAANAALNFSGSTAIGLYGPLTNAGTVTATGTGYLRPVYVPSSGDYGSVYNLSGGLFDIQDDQFYIWNFSGNEFFDNAGTLRKSAGTGTTIIYPLVTNSGLVDVETGTMNLAGGGTIDGQYNAAAGATILFNGNFISGANPQLTGGGADQFVSGTLTLLSNTIPNLQMNGGTLALGPKFQGGSITNLTLAGMVLSGANLVTGTATLGGGSSGPLTVAANAVLTCTAGNFCYPSGSITVAANAALNFSGSTAIGLYGPLTNAGTVTATGTGYLRPVYVPSSGDYGSVYNLSGGLFDIQDDQFYIWNFSGNEFFDNAGTLRKSAGSGITIIYPLVTNSGLVDVETGTMNLAGGGTIDGQYNAAAGATILFNGNFISGANPQLTGGGADQFVSGTLTLLSNTIPNLQMNGGTLALGPKFQGGSITNLTLAGMVLSGANLVTGTATLGGGSSGPLTVAANAVLTCTAGNFCYPSGSITVAANAALNFSGSTAIGLYGPLTNAGTVTATGTGYLRPVYVPSSGDYGSVYNLSGGLFDIQDDQFYIWNFSGNEFFDNAGTLRKSAGSGITIIYPLVTNSGLVDVETGTMNLAGGGTIDGQYNAAAGATILFNGNFISGANPQLTGGGADQFVSGTLTLLSNTIPNLQMNGGTLALGPKFQGGSITNLTLAGMVLSGANLVTGTATLGGGSSGPLTVAANAVLTCTAGNFCYPSGSITVAANAALNFSGSTAIGLYGPLTNAGTVTATGTGYLRPVYVPSSGDYGSVYNLSGGLFDIQDDQFYIWNFSGNEFFDNAGTLRKSAGTGTTAIYTLVSNSGTVDVLTGTMSFTSSFTNIEGTLNFGVSGVSSFGQINIAGNVALNGTASLEWLSGFAPAVGDGFTLLRYGSYSGTFANINLPAGTVAQTNYSATAFSLLITATSGQGGSPVLSIIKPLPTDVVVSWPASAANFGLQTTTDLSSRTWTSITAGISTVAGNFVYTNPVTGNATFFRLRSN